MREFVNSKKVEQLLKDPFVNDVISGDDGIFYIFSFNRFILSIMGCFNNNGEFQEICE